MSTITSNKYKHLYKSIREKCLDCCLGSRQEVKQCSDTCCGLYDLRIKNKKQNSQKGVDFIDPILAISKKCADCDAYQGEVKNCKQVKCPLFKNKQW